MLCSRSLCWVASLAAVVLLLPGCDNSDDTAAFDFSRQSLCDWLSPEEMDEIVKSTFEELGVQPLPEEHFQSQGGDSGCSWQGDTWVGLSLKDGPNFPDSSGVPHAALDDSVRARIEVDGRYGFFDGTDAFLFVDGHDEQLHFEHSIPDNFGGDVGTINGDVEMIKTVGLTIANKMLQQMEWVESD
jgi:hypothetical protein